MAANQFPQNVETSLILAVDHNSHNLKLLKQFLEQAGFQTITANSLDSLTQILETPGLIQLALIDISGFDRRIWTHCEQLRSQQIPFLILAKQNASIQQQSLSHGAQGMLVKPLVVKELLALIRSLLEMQT